MWYYCPTVVSCYYILLYIDDTQLRSLGIEECGLSDAAVIAIARHAPQLRTIGLNGNTITDVGAMELVRQIPCIEVLQTLLY